MPITIYEDSLFKNEYPIKYLVGYDQMFNRDRFNGCLNFYDGNPQYIVNVEVVEEDKTKLREEDIMIITGEYHNASDIAKKIDENKDTIFEFCKTINKTKFCLDLEKMKVVEIEDFNSFLPTRGLNTLFMFENVHNQYYCLVNPARSIKNIDFYSWLVSYIYSTVVCLTPNSKIDEYSKQFLQAISILFATKGNKKAVHIAESKSVLNCSLGDINEKLLPIPGNKTERFEALVEKSLEQMKRVKDKKKEKNKK